MEWLELSLSVPAEQVEEAARLLEEIVPSGCSIEDPIVPLGPEEGVRREPWRPSIVRAYLPVDGRLDERRAAAHAALAALPGAPGVAERPVREEDWAHAWKEFFQVEHIGRRIVIRPTWREYEPLPGETVIDLDPGMAFGTGQHETTRLCLAALEERPRAGDRVLDLGCGSGILAVAAAKLGAAEAVALDIEDVAIEATRENAARNGVAARIVAARGSLGSDWPLAEPAARAFDLVLANIHAAAIIALAPRIAEALRRPGATLVASGIVVDRLPAVLDALARSGFTAPDVRAAGDWRAVICVRA